MADAIDAMQLLREDVKDDDYELQIAAINKLVTVAIALGPTRTVSELLPFLTEFVDGDNDEAATAVARQLGAFPSLVGGPTQANLLLPLIEKLCTQEEWVVRNAAVISCNQILAQLPKTDVAAKVVPMIKRLANGDWFTARVSACGLFASTYTYVSDEKMQGELRSLFSNLCSDDTPMVRKAAFQNLGAVGGAVQKHFFKSDFLPILKTLAVDDMDFMRLHTIDCCVELADKMDPADYAANIVPLIEGLHDDASWKVRQHLARQMPILCARTPEAVCKRLLPSYAKLLQDREAEVRSLACSLLVEVAAAAKTNLVEVVGPILDALVIDQVPNVRVAISKSLIGCTPHFGKEVAVKLLLPLVQQLTKDENAEVRNNIIDSLDILLGSEAMVNGVLPALLDLSKDLKWRVRMAVVDKSALLGRSLGVKTFEKKLQQIVIVGLSDHVFAIREAACAQMGRLVDEFGGKWAAEKLFASAFAIYDKTTNYLHRMTCLLVISSCAASNNLGAEVLEKNLLPIVITACTDDVPNVRLQAAKTMGDIIPRIDKAISSSKIKPLLLKLSKDADGDVIFFANQSLKLIK